MCQRNHHRAKRKFGFTNSFKPENIPEHYIQLPHLGAKALTSGFPRTSLEKEGIKSVTEKNPSRA